VGCAGDDTHAADERAQHRAHGGRELEAALREADLAEGREGVREDGHAVREEERATKADEDARDNEVNAAVRLVAEPAAERPEQEDP
jgi:hypothetical protein